MEQQGQVMLPTDRSSSPVDLGESFTEASDTPGKAKQIRNTGVGNNAISVLPDVLSLGDTKETFSVVPTNNEPDSNTIASSIKGYIDKEY